MTEDELRRLEPMLRKWQRSSETVVFDVFAWFWPCAQSFMSYATAAALNTQVSGPGPHLKMSLFGYTKEKTV